ncbi:MAG: hypothetical protein ACJASL_004301 [Paraglaciecola sp.]|jgi:hypothetical protein
MSLSGQLFSQTGPMVETHDASTDSRQNHGLFGFIGWPSARRSQITEHQLKGTCVAQLVSCCGPNALDFIECFSKIGLKMNLHAPQKINLKLLVILNSPYRNIIKSLMHFICTL